MLSIYEECKSHGLEQNRVSPSGETWGGGIPPVPQKLACLPHVPHCFHPKCQFCNFHAVFGHFAQTVPPPVDRICEILQNDFNKRNHETDENDGDGSSSSDSDGDDDAVWKYYRWKKAADGYLTKICIETEISESLTLW